MPKMYQLCQFYCIANVHTRCLRNLFLDANSYVIRMRFRQMTWSSQEPGKQKFDKKKQSFKRKTERNHVEFQMDHISQTTRVLYKGLRLKQPFMDKQMTIVESAKSYSNTDAKASVSLEFQNVLKLIKNNVLRHTNKKSFFHEETSFRTKCERMSDHELTALVYHMVNSNNGTANIMKSDQPDRLFNILERELCRRVNASFQNEHNNEMFSTFESILHPLIWNKVGFRFFQTYVRYCTYRSASAVTVNNVPLLLLSLCRVRFDSQMVFAFLEEFMLEHFNQLDLKIISLFCVTFFICNMPIDSDQLLNLIGTRLLHDLKAYDAANIPPHDITNILKILRHSGYTKGTFYSDLECSLVDENYMDSCNITQAVQILNTYVSFKIYPPRLLEKVVERAKKLLKEGNITRYRIKDIGTFVNMLGTYQFKDSGDVDVYALCADSIIQQLRRESDREPLWYMAMYLCSCATGLVYAGKFNDGVVDFLFGIPNVVDYLEETRRVELLVLHHTIQLEYPHYKGRQIRQEDIESLQRKVSEAWTLEKELDVTGDLEDQVKILKSLIGADRLSVGYILPYLRTADITLFLDDSDNLVQPQFATKKVAVEVIAWGQCIRGTDRLLGKYIMKMRHLEKLGYKIIMVGPQERLHVMQYGSSRDKRDFWIKKLQENDINIDCDWKIKKGDKSSLSTKYGRKS